MPEEGFQQMLQLFICCNYCGQEEALELVAPPSPTVAVVPKACGLQVSPGYFDTQSSPSFSRSSSFGSNKSSSGKFSSRGSSQVSTSHSESGGGGSQCQPAECNDDDEECDGGKHTLTNTELTSQQAALLSCFSEMAQGKKAKSSKAKVSKKESRDEAKAKQMRGNNAASLTFFF